MSAELRRCVALGPNGVINPGSSQDYANNRDFLLDTGTKWVRMWADWPSLQPESTAPDHGTGATRLAALDAQIEQAATDGISVILTSWRFPRWANGTAGLTDAQDASYQLHDRVHKGQDSAQRKALEFRLPADLSASGAWASWIAFLAGRYRGRLAFLEICNEPNLQMWPLEGPSPTSDPYDQGPLVVQKAVARMFAGAQAVAGDQPLLGPGPADRSTGGNRLSCDYDVFGSALLDELDSAGFEPGRRFAWAHHNYTDVEADQGSHAATARGLLVGRWAGWPDADASQPRMLITEGGARLPKIAAAYGNSDPAFVLGKQADLVQHNWDRSYLDPAGAGIAMVSQYLFSTDLNFDDGLNEADGTPRPAYDTWSALPVVSEEPAPPPQVAAAPAATPAPAPPPPAVASPQAAPAPPLPALTLALALRPQRLSRILGRGLHFSVSCSGPCSVVATLAHDRRTLASASRGWRAHGTAAMVLRLDRRARRSLAGGSGRTWLTLAVTATGAGGATRTVSRRLRVRL